MEINVDKCELITNNQNITIIDEVTNQPIKTCTHAKYLGQTINNLAETNDIILRRSYNSIAQLIHTSETFITLKSRIKLFKIYIKSKYTHLLPLMSINGNIEKHGVKLGKQYSTIYSKEVPNQKNQLLFLDVLTIQSLLNHSLK